MNKEQIYKPLYCESCGAEFMIKRFRAQLPEIVRYCILRELELELYLLNKTEQMYIDFPESESKMVPEWKLGKNEAPDYFEIEKWTNGDNQLRDFLLTSSFDLFLRRSYVKKLISEQSSEAVICPKCNTGLVVFKDGQLREYRQKLT